MRFNFLLMFDLFLCVYVALFTIFMIWMIWNIIPVGTRSLLLGVHCWFVHPFTVALAWKRLYGFPWDHRLWLAFFVHDWGYWGHRQMDSEEAEKHVELGARIMHRLCDTGQFNPHNSHEWEQFSLYHSRFYAKANNAQFSRLCVADKAAFYTEPYLFYMLRARLSGEVWEYLEQQPDMPTGLAKRDKLKWWHAHVTRFLIAWVNEHKDCKPDEWTDPAGDRKSVIPTASHYN